VGFGHQDFETKWVPCCKTKGAGSRGSSLRSERETMMENKCKNCVFGISFQHGKEEIVLCTNNPDKPGELVETRPVAKCKNYTAGPLRREPSQPANDKVRYIPLTRGLYAIVDAEDYEWASKFKWHASGPDKYPYAVRVVYYGNGRKITLYLHREITAAPKELLVDHINGNTLDDRSENLRLATKSENAWNMRVNKEGCSSIYRGVGWHKGVGKWVAKITVHGKRIHIGVFDDEIEAAKAYDEAAKQYHGEFARLNFPEEDTLS